MRSEMTNPADGQSVPRRSVLTCIDEGHHSMEMDFDTPEVETKAMEIQHLRR